MSPIQETRIIKLRKEHRHYGKKKPKVLQEKEYGKDINCWKIERAIRRYKLFPDKVKAKESSPKNYPGETTSSGEGYPLG